MPLEMDELDFYIHQAQMRVRERIILANRTDTLDEVLTELGIHRVPSLPRLPVSRSAKILVCGALACSQNEARGVIKAMGLDPSRVTFLSYEDAKRLDLRRLANDTGTSDILFGPIPHMTAGTGSYSSLIAAVEANQDIYPRSTRITTKSGELKITKTALREALMKTRMYEEFRMGPLNRH